MYTILILVLIAFLIWKRKKIHWPGLLAGVVVAVLLLGTPLGSPMVDMVHALAHGVSQAGHAVMHLAGGGR